MMHVFKAPTWEVPIMQFIDDNCIVFDNDDENKFSYSDIHQVKQQQLHANMFIPYYLLFIISSYVEIYCPSGRFVN